MYFISSKINTTVFHSNINNLKEAYFNFFLPPDDTLGILQQKIFPHGIMSDDSSENFSTIVKNWGWKSDIL